MTFNLERRILAWRLIITCIIIIYGDSRLWPMGLVVQCSNGRDGMIRSARVKTQATELVRPITKLVLLEC